ncbi:MAG: DUF3500 domain-containing protein [Galactobacter sp.]
MSTPTTATADFRRFQYAQDAPRLRDLDGLDAYAYREVSKERGTFTGELVAGWTPLYLNDFHGISTDGTVHPEIFDLGAPVPGEEAPVREMVAAANHLLDVVTPEQRERLVHAVDAVEWQTWANPEFMQFDTGLRLENVDAPVREAVYALINASLSAEGERLVRLMMRINGFLGDVVGLPGILNEFSYNVSLYGTPDPVKPWGWQLYGHHCAINVFVVNGRMSVGPMFLGAEPNEIDEGVHAGEGAFEDRIATAYSVMAQLNDEQLKQVVTYQQMVDPAMPEGRVHPGDERHLAGAFQDNRVIPNEGAVVSTLPEAAQRGILELLEQANTILPAGPLAARMREIEAHLDETYFSWIGGHQPGDVFYFRIQSPVVIAELDHHCGVFLDYDVPQRFHIHTVLRTPNGNDYGRAWLRQWQAEHPAESA